MLNVVLYEPEIPANTGNIMRTCVATNTKLHLIKPLGFSLDEKNVKRSGANYINDCNYTLYEDIDDFFSKNIGTFYFLTRYGQKTGDSFDYSDINENIYFVFGKESSGIPKEILKKQMKTCIRIPMSEYVRSLNLSNTVAIMVYEALRQQRYPNLSLDEIQKGADYLMQ